MILNDGEGLRALEVNQFLSFDVEGQDRMYVFPCPSSLMTVMLNGSNSFRIDGKSEFLHDLCISQTNCFG